MPFTLIKGTFHIDGYSPDGDSIRFEAADPTNWKKLAGPAVSLNARHHAQLRLEGIDTLETHYGGHRQPLEFAQAATTFLLSQLGFVVADLDVHSAAVTSSVGAVQGFILSRAVEKNHRPVSFVFAADSQEADGASVFFTPERLEQSVNLKSLDAGMAYPTYYTGLFPDLRERMTEVVRAARTIGKGLWPQDKTNDGFKVIDIASVIETNVIMPKLFRRIVDYIGNGGSIAGFKEHLAANPDPVLSLATGHFTNLDTFIEVTDDFVKLTAQPEDLVFLG